MRERGIERGAFQFWGKLTLAKVGWQLSTQSAFVYPRLSRFQGYSKPSQGFAPKEKWVCFK